jgi:hypothetical protein
VVQHLLLNPLARRIIEGSVPTQSLVRVDVKDGALDIGITATAPDAPLVSPDAEIDPVQ